MGPIWIWRFLLKAVKVLTFTQKHTGGTGGGGGGHKSSVWHIVPDVLSTALGWLF